MKKISHSKNVDESEMKINFSVFCVNFNILFPFSVSENDKIVSYVKYLSFSIFAVIVVIIFASSHNGTKRKLMKMNRKFHDEKPIKS